MSPPYFLCRLVKNHNVRLQSTRNCTEALIDGNVLVLFRSLPVKSKQNWNQRKGSTLKAALCWHIAAKFSTYRIQLALGLLLACSFPLGISPQNFQYARRSFTIYGVNLKWGSVFGVNSWNWHCACLSDSLFFLVVDIQCSNLDEGDTKAAERSSEKVRCAFLDLQLRMFGYVTSRISENLRL